MPGRRLHLTRACDAWLCDCKSPDHNIIKAPKTFEQLSKTVLQLQRIIRAHFAFQDDSGTGPELELSEGVSARAMSRTETTVVHGGFPGIETGTGTGPLCFHTESEDNKLQFIYGFLPPEPSLSREPEPLEPFHAGTVTEWNRTRPTLTLLN